MTTPIKVPIGLIIETCPKQREVAYNEQLFIIKAAKSFYFLHTGFERYKMVFVPFTAIDNYGRSVAVCSGLLKRETTEAYRWLQRAFKKAFVRAPNIVVAHQDGSIRLVVAAEFPESKHRLCMWHIM
ncbi:FAR1-related sequence 5-like protein [Tanacetum coccineum]